MKKIGIAIIKLLVFALATAAIFWLINFNVQVIAKATYKEGIKQGWNACKKDTGVGLETWETNYQNLIVGHRDQP